jgi:hypothetical protein
MTEKATIKVAFSLSNLAAGKMEVFLAAKSK